MQLLAKKVLIFLFCAFFFSCKTTRDEKRGKDNPNGELGLIQAIQTRSNVNILRLDDIDFRVDKVRANLQNFLNYQTPTVIFTLPELADYVQIIRCDKDALIYGGDRLIDWVALTAKDAKTEAAIFARNNFWEAASNNSNCTLVASSNSSYQFEDMTAPDGSFRYYIRACIDPTRIEGASGITTVNCSRQIAATNDITNQNFRRLGEISALAKAQKLEDEIYQLGRKLQAYTIDLNNQLAQCQTKEQARIAHQEALKELTDLAKSNVASSAQTTGVAVGIIAGVGVGYGGYVLGKRLYQPASAAASNTLSKIAAKAATSYKESATNRLPINKRQAATYGVLNMLALGAAAGGAAWAGTQVISLMSTIDKTVSAVGPAIPKDTNPVCYEGNLFKQANPSTTTAQDQQLVCACSRAAATINNLATSSIEFYLKTDERRQSIDSAYKNSVFGSQESP